MAHFRDRVDAGRQLAAKLAPYAAEHPVVLALPRGGVPVAYEVARALSAPLDVWVVRKIGAPFQPELGLGAVAEGGFLYLSRAMLRELGIPEASLAGEIAAKRAEVEARVKLFRGGRPSPELRDRTVIVIDDGIATGGTVRAAIRSIRAQGPKKVVLAVPVASPSVLRELEEDADQTEVLTAPGNLMAIGLWYDDFTQTSDDEVARLLERARAAHAASAPAPRAPGP